MEVLTKSLLPVKEEKGVRLDEEGGEQDFRKFGCESPGHEENCSKSSSPSRKDSSISKQVSYAYASERSSDDTTSASRNPRDLNMCNEEAQLEFSRAEMGEVREENERLKTVLSRILKDYQSLQMQLLSTIQKEQQAAKVPKSDLAAVATAAPKESEEEEADMVSLSLGTSASGGSKKANGGCKSKDGGGGEKVSGGLSLGLDCGFDERGAMISGSAPQPDPEATLSSSKEEEEPAGEQWPPSKVLKTTRSTEDDEVSQQVQVKKARVSVRARCDTPTMNDGCQWRKYGQKISKGNPCPRAYYRCTVAPACPVRKQVQRCADDMSILITTYEGTHNHPLPMAATAMASTTAAAASMLVSGSTSSSASRPGFGAALPTMTSASLHGLNFSLSDSTRTRPYYLPSNMSTSPPYPTITLDLTAPPAPPSMSAHGGRSFPPTSQSTDPQTTARNPYSTGFHFSTLDSNNIQSQAPPPPPSWNSTGYLGYGSQLFRSNSSQAGALNLTAAGRSQQAQAQEPLIFNPSVPSYLQRIAKTGAGGTPPAPPDQGTCTALTDTIAKAITTDPSFQSVLAAAITSIVGGGQGQGQEAPLGQKLRLGSSSAPPLQSSLSSFLNRNGASSQSSSQQGNVMVLQQSLAFANTKSTSSPPPVEKREHIT